MDYHHILDLVVLVLVIVGALNWGMVGAFGMDVVARIFGGGSMVARVIYILIGVAGLVMLIEMY
jgi:uncharacterized membrane protein YuzA (DUF378 family)